MTNLILTHKHTTRDGIAMEFKYNVNMIKLSGMMLYLSPRVANRYYLLMYKFQLCKAYRRKFTDQYGEILLETALLTEMSPQYSRILHSYIALKNGTSKIPTFDLCYVATAKFAMRGDSLGDMREIIGIVMSPIMQDGFRTMGANFREVRAVDKGRHFFREFMADIEEGLSA